MQLRSWQLHEPNDVRHFRPDKLPRYSLQNPHSARHYTEIQILHSLVYMDDTALLRQVHILATAFLHTSVQLRDAFHGLGFFLADELALAIEQETNGLECPSGRLGGENSR